MIRNEGKMKDLLMGFKLIRFGSKYKLFLGTAIVYFGLGIMLEVFSNGSGPMGFIYLQSHAVGLGIPGICGIASERSALVAHAYYRCYVEYEFDAVRVLAVVIICHFFCQTVDGFAACAEFEIGKFYWENNRPVLCLGMNRTYAEHHQHYGGEYGSSTIHRHKVSKRRNKKQRAASLTALDP